MLDFKEMTPEMDYFCFGEGSRPFVILPGMSLKSVMLSAGFIKNAFSAFSRDFKVHVFDRVRNMPDDYSVSGMAEDTVLMMKSLNIQEACIYGASQGAMMALTIAAQHPEMVSRLALASTSSRPNPVSAATMTRWEELARGSDAAALNRDVFSKVYSPEYYHRYQKAFSLLEPEGTPEEMRRFAIMAAATRTFDMYSSLDRISCPVFLAGMEEDTVLGSQGVREIADRLGCELLLYPGKGHACYDEDPQFPARLLTFAR